MAEKRTAKRVARTKPKRQQPERLGSPSRLPSWERQFKELEAFKEKHGHCNVPGQYKSNPALGNWVSTVRRQRKRGELDEEIIDCLNALGFCWARQTTWEQRIHDLKAFKQKHGHCNVPNWYPSNPGLGAWVSGVRRRKKLGKLAEDRILLLDALGFCWDRSRHGRRGQ